MQCPYCQATKTATLDSRQTALGRRRRRRCEKCGRRFTTEESLFRKLPMISKASGETEEFNEDKLRRSLQLALRKRGVAGSRINELVDRIKGGMYALGASDIDTQWIGRAVMETLKHVDSVAYIRYASVYRSFDDMDAFIEEIQELKKDLTPEQRSMQLPLLAGELAKGSTRRRR